MTPVRRRAAAGLAFLAALGAGGCGSASEPSPPTGVDGLVIPTPSPDPADFVAEVDNPWLPLRRYARWEYQVRDDAGRSTVVVTVEPGPRIAGVTTTAMQTVPEGKGATDAAAVTDYYAQDRAGNVWWFGRDGEWRAGADGAEAGLAMPAGPRRGDGFRMALALGPAPRAEITALDEDRTVPAGDFADLVEMDVTTGDVVERRYYAEDVGLVATESVGLGRTTGLVAYDEPR